MTPRGSIGNINLGLNEPKSPDTIWKHYFGAKDGIIKVERWPSLTVGPNWFLSLYRVEAKWSVGRSVANVTKESCPRSTIDSSRHFQTSKWTNANHFSINHNHPRRPQTPLTEPQKIQDFQLFGNRSSDYDPPRLNWQHQPRPK